MCVCVPPPLFQHEWLGKYFRRTQLTSLCSTHFNDNHIHATFVCNLQREIICVVRTFAMQFPISKLNRNFISLNDSGIFRNVLSSYFPGARPRFHPTWNVAACIVAALAEIKRQYMPEIIEGEEKEKTNTAVKV